MWRIAMDVLLGDDLFIAPSFVSGGRHGPIKPCCFERLPQKRLRRIRIAPGRQSEINQAAELINCSPEIVPFAADPNVDPV